MKNALSLVLLGLHQLLFAQSALWNYYQAPPDVNCLTAMNNTILAGTKGAGLVRFDTLLNRQNYHAGNSGLPSDTILQLAIDVKGDWWVEYPGGIARYNGVSWQSWTLGQTGLSPNAKIRAMKAAPDSSIYVATDNGVAICKNMNWFSLNNSNSGLLSNDVWDVAFHPDGKVYYATSGNGLMEQNGLNWASYTSANTGVSNMNNVFSVACTQSGTIWICGGISQATPIRLAKFDQGIWTGYTTASIGITGGTLLRKVAAGHGDQLWLTTASTVSLLDNQGWTHFAVNSNFGCGAIQVNASAPSIAGYRQVWLQTCGVAVFDGQKWRKPGTGLPGPAQGTLFNGLASDKEGNIWIGSEFGHYISRFDGLTWSQYFPTDFGATRNSVFSIQETPGGTLWFGLDNAELLKLEGGNWTFFDTCASVFPGYVLLASATAPNGDQWFSCVNPTPLSSGLARYSPNGQWQFYSSLELPALQNTYIEKIVFMPDGTGWFSTGLNGLLKYADGVNWNVVNTSNSNLPDNSIFDLDLAPDGSLWACTDAGATRLVGNNWITLNTINSGLLADKTRAITFDKAGGMYVGYFSEIGGVFGAISVLRQGVWDDFTPPYWENTVDKSPDAFITDNKNRLWFADFSDPGVYVYDPLVVPVKNAAEIKPLQVSPNPCSGQCNILLNVRTEESLRVRVHNSMGHLVLDQTATVLPDDSGIALDLTHLPPGTYKAHIWGGKDLVGIGTVMWIR